MKKLLVAIFLFMTAYGSCQLKNSSFAFMLGTDTVGYEQYTRSVDKIEGDIVTFSPRTTIAHFSALLGKKEMITHFEYYSAYPATGIKIMDRQIDIENDTSVHQSLSMSGKLDSFFTRSFHALPGAVPHLDFDIAMYEQMILQEVRSGKDSLALDRLTNGPIHSYVKGLRQNEYQSRVFGFPVFLRTDASNRVINYDATATTVKLLARKIPDFDFMALVDRYVKIEKLNGTMGNLSATDTIRTSFKNADFLVSYGRPFRRGRVIFGDVVPWNKVWRTGANYATHFSTSKDLNFGSFLLPAGRYTLWTLPGTEGTKLIINKSVNIFGTQYNPRNDLVRLDMTQTALQNLTEQFTIELKETTDGGKLLIKWERTEYSIDFRIGN